MAGAKKAVLVTGANGFVGEALCAKLTIRNLKVLPVVRPKSQPLTSTSTGRLFVVDINENTNWTQALMGVDCVVHLAARVHVHDETQNAPIVEFRRVNFKLTINLARQAAAAGVRRFVFISSIKVNGNETPVGRLFTEDDEPQPNCPYGMSKNEAETSLRQLAAQTGMEVVIIRPPLVYGPGAKANFAALMRAVQRGWPLPLAAVHNHRSLVALDNLVDFIFTCITHPAAANQTFLVSDGQDLSTSELVRCMAQAAGVPSRLLPVPVWAMRLAGRMLGKADAIDRLCGNLQVDISKARTLLGWAPPVSLQEGLVRAMLGGAQNPGGN